ncbi:hypothetical protein KIPB_011177, partial [Kipferlia bialata]|eukprot:g11177.t1
MSSLLDALTLLILMAVCACETPAQTVFSDTTGSFGLDSTTYVNNMDVSWVVNVNMDLASVQC